MRVTLAALLSLFFVIASGCGGNRPCSSATCAVGCCDSSGRCQTGSFSAACGIGGATCSVCSVTQTCSQGQCIGSNSGAGTGAGGGFSGTGGGSSGPQVEVMPSSATVVSGGALTLSGRVVGGVDNGVAFSLAQGGGSLSRTSPSTAIFYAASGNSTVRILATSVQNTSLSRFIDLNVSPTLERFSVAPESPSSNALLLPPGSKQTFSGVRTTTIPNSPSPSSMVVGVSGLQWFVWPSGTIDGTGTLTAATTDERVYAREPSTNLWSSADVTVTATNTNAIAISPAVSTVTRGGVVQLTAMVSSGAAVTWRVSPNGGSVNSTGTYTAPNTPGVFLVQATAGSQYALATIVVQ
ncbi:MAG: hypothetical protein GQE15_13275 [Archangiaceae bacterium]|nr:hypothetical protein [Archangiaceae bacterium]